MRDLPNKKKTPGTLAAAAAAKNVDGTNRAAYIITRDEHGPKRTWLDFESFGILNRLTVEFTDGQGESHIRFKNPVLAWLADIDQKKRTATAGTVTVPSAQEGTFLRDTKKARQQRQLRRATTPMKGINS